MIYKTKFIYLIIMVYFSIVITGCNNNHLEQSSNFSHYAKNEHKLWDFEDDEYVSFLNANNAETSLVKDGKNSKLAVLFKSKDHHESDIEFVNYDGWNWQGLGNFTFALDIENPSLKSTQLYVKTHDKKGKAQSRSVVVPAGSNNTYYIELKGADLNAETGIRSNPPSWISRFTPILYRGGNKNIDVSQILKVSFGTKGLLEDKQLYIDNIRLIKPTNFDTQYLVGLVDKFGQNSKQNFTNKISSTEQLLSISNQEQAQLNKSPLKGRSKFSGWQEGPKLKATGYFRTEKYQGKWSLVDPQGYLFFSTGIANVRLANTTTITGYDFDEQYIKQRAPGDLTPEDSIGLNTAPKEAWPSRYISSEVRANMFNWLPDSDDSLADNYGYRREVHSGAVKKGETFSFYRANLQRKYQTREEQTLMKKWRDTTTDRMLSWGFTSFGNWLDDDYYQQNRLPYFANAWIIGDYKTVSSGNDYWSPLPDPFDPAFIKRADITLATVAKQVNSSPWCVGVFIDNEKSWGMMGSVNSQYGLVINTLSTDATQSPTKAEFVKLMKDKYQDITVLNANWNSNIASWYEFSSGVTVKNINKQVKADFSIMLFHYANQYFSVVEQATAKHLPNHLYMGARFADWGMTPEIRKAAAVHADVVSYNYYREGLNDDFWDFLKELDKPSIIGEFHNGSLDSGLLNPGLVHAESQLERGVMYKNYMETVINNPYFVGAHWFQYIDSPLTGRAYDGENYNVGFVNVADIPYQPLVQAAKEVNETLYLNRYGYHAK